MLTYRHNHVIIVHESAIKSSEGYEENNNPCSNAKCRKREKSLRQELVVFIVCRLHWNTNRQHDYTRYLKNTLCSLYVHFITLIHEIHLPGIVNLLKLKCIWRWWIFLLTFSLPRYALGVRVISNRLLVFLGYVITQ